MTTPNAEAMKRVGELLTPHEGHNVSILSSQTQLSGPYLKLFCDDCRRTVILTRRPRPAKASIVVIFDVIAAEAADLPGMEEMVSYVTEIIPKEWFADDANLAPDQQWAITGLRPGSRVVEG